MKINRTKKEVKLIQTAVLQWHVKNGRHDLPWRNLSHYSVDIPYGVLVSEVMLQQTQVDRVKPKFLNFITNFPSVFKLAQTSTHEVIHLWAGLGYNRRAIMLHRAAQQIVDLYNGTLPSDEEKLLALSGIGPYTARAIMSFGFNLPVAVVDTNIRRFYELLVYGYNLPKDKEVSKLAERFLLESDSRRWHSALMDIMSSLKAISPAEQQQELIQLLCLYLPDLPPLSSAPLLRPKQSTFIGSKRFYRGQIIKLLRESNNHSLSLAVLKKRIELPTHYDYEDIITRLRKDGLLHYNDPLIPETELNL